MLLRYYLSHRRLRKSTEIVIAEVPDSPESALSPDLRVTLTAALRLLPPRNRAVVVLRYLEDRSIEEVADLLGMSTGSVKSLNTRSLAKLRGIFRRRPRADVPLLSRLPFPPHRTVSPEEPDEPGHGP